MTLDEAIEHAEQIVNSYNDIEPNCDCAKEHRQLVEWLKELKYYRENIETFKPIKIIKYEPKVIKTGKAKVNFIKT